MGLVGLYYIDCDWLVIYGIIGIVLVLVLYLLYWENDTLFDMIVDNMGQYFHLWSFIDDNIDTITITIDTITIVIDTILLLLLSLLLSLLSYYYYHYYHSFPY